jgi:tetratricopeptide (TPR) repeat protein
MSLLLDALKRAEQEKLARNEPAAPAPPPPPGPRAVPPVAPSLELQPIAAAAAAAPAASARTDARAAQVVFQAKAAGSAPPPNGERRMGMVWATAGAIAVVAVAAGAYVWYSINALKPSLAAAPRPRPMPVTSPTPLPLTTAALEEMVAQAPAAPRSAPAVAPEPEVAKVAPAVPEAPQAPAAVTPEALLRESPPPAPPLQFDRSAAPSPQVPAEVSAGYAALREGDLQAARGSYERALATDPSSLDARLGLATTEARAGNAAAAAHHYRRALEVDPRNATAMAGLAALSDLSRPDAMEQQLRMDVERQPGSSALRFALGSLFASQGRWHDAQAEFFEAHRLAPGAPDVLFNLAVSLDHLGQARLAADFYARALDAARAQPAQFDPAAAARRLAEIR